MNLKDFFHRKKNEESKDETIRVCKNRIEFLEDAIQKLKEAFNSASNEHVAEMNELERKLINAEKTKRYKTGTALKEIQTTLNNSTSNSFTYKGPYTNIEIKNGKVFIDGKEQEDITNCKNKNIFIKLENSCDIDITNTDKITIQGAVNNVNVTNGDIYCDNILGNIDMTNGNIYRRY